MCSIWGAGCSFYSGEGWPWRSARVAVVVVGPVSRRGKAWVRTVAGVLAKLTRVIVARQGLCGDGEFDGKGQYCGGDRSRGRRLRRSRGPVRVSRWSSDSSRVDWR